MPENTFSGRNTNIDYKSLKLTFYELLWLSRGTLKKVIFITYMKNLSLPMQIHFNLTVHEN